MHSERNRRSCASCHRSACRIAQWSESLTCKFHRFRSLEKNVEVIQLVPHERVVEQIIDVQKPQVMEKIVKVPKKTLSKLRTRRTDTLQLEKISC